MTAKVTIGEVFLCRKEWKLCFSCFECGLELEQIDHFLLHTLLHDVRQPVTSGKIIQLVRQLNGIKEYEDGIQCAGEMADGNDDDSRKSPEADHVAIDAMEVAPNTQPGDSRIMEDPKEDSSNVFAPSSNPPGPSATEASITASGAFPPFKCHLCPKTFSTERWHRRHLQKHTEAQQYACPKCKATMKDETNFLVHMKRHLGLKEHACPECSKAFVTSTELKLHMRSHTGDKPFACDECERTFATSSSLLLHRRHMHRNERPYVCSHCGKSFHSSTALKEHEKSHSAERNLTCPVCSKSFKQLSAYSQHKKLHNPKKAYACSQCGKEYAQNSGLYSHMKTHKRQQAKIPKE